MPRSNFDSLPLKRSLAREYLISFIVAVIMLLASAAGIIFRDVMYPTDELLVGFVSTDLLNIVVGLPILLVSMYLARRGRLGGLLCWPGALLYVLYIYTSYMGIPMNWMLIPHIIQIVLSAYLIIAIVSSIDSEAVRHRLDGAVPARSTGGILFGIGVLVIAWVAVQIGTAIINQVRPERMALIQIINDLVVGCPALVISGYLLLRRRGWGYVAGAGLLLMSSVL
ncbi:MAG: hypothetical protein KOO63_16130, partial [Bacteroidales bacterium]|nr:hypothetical protein [Candidatus Latescibacterota bacterium]